MTLSGVFRNGVVVLEEPYEFPDGTLVEVIVREKPSAGADKPSLTGLLELAGTVDDLPSDMARNHDHYLHGAPKR